MFNPDPAGAGETTFLFEITGGTGALTGASGYIIAAANAEVPGVLVRHAPYTGELILP